MKKFTVVLFILTLLLTACAPTSMEQPQLPDGASYPNPSYPNQSYPNPSYPNDDLSVETGSLDVPADDLQVDNPIDAALINQLAGNLRVDTGTISVVSNEPVEFSDACLGVAMQDVMCAEVITPGRVVVLESNGIQYEYHINEDGTRIQPATFALTWKREGGIAGFCDSLTVFLSGEVYGNQCKSQPDGTMGTFATLLSTLDREKFDSWIADYGQVTLDASDPKGVADGMTNIIVLTGLGNDKPDTPVEEEIFKWAQELFRNLYN